MLTDTPSTEVHRAAEAGLLGQVRTGDPASCEPLIEHFGTPLYHYLYWLTGSRDEAAIHFKDTVLHLFLNPGRVRKERSLRNWIFRRATQTWLQRRTQRQRQRRSSLDNVLRGGLAESREIPWADWLSQCGDLPGERVAAVEPVVDGFEALPDGDRAALLLHTVAGLPLEAVAATLRLSPRNTRKVLVSAFEGLVSASGSGKPGTNMARTLACRHVLGLDTPRQGKKFQQLLGAHPEYGDHVEGGISILAILRDLPLVSAPAALTADTTTHLAEGHAALETRIATWGFRFMQVTVPLFILAILAVILLPAITRSREMARRAAASENLETLGKALRAYSDAAPGKRYPPLTAIDGLWVPDLERLYPRYIASPDVLVSPSVKSATVAAALTQALNESPPDWVTAHQIFAQSYIYTGYTLLDTSAFSAFTALRDAQPELDLEGDLETADRRFYRLRQGVEQFFVGMPRANAGESPGGAVRIPIMFERFSPTGFGGNPEGANVLYLDGTVAYVPFGSAFPVDATVMALLQEKERRR